MDIFAEDLIIIYTAILYIAGFCNVVYALVLFYRAFSKKYKAFPSYRPATIGVASALLVFGLPYFIHAVFSVRLLIPIVATAIGLTSFHIGAVLFAYSYTKLLSPRPISRRRNFLNIIMTIAGILTYCSAVAYVIYGTIELLGNDEMNNGWVATPFWIYIPFFLHAFYLVYRIYSLYNKLRTANPETLETTLRPFIESLPKSVHVIVLCGIGSIVLYCVFPEGLHVYTILMFVAYFAFYYIYRALTNYGKSLLANPDEQKRTNRGARLFRYNALYHSVLLVLFLGVFYIFSERQSPNTVTTTELPHLSLTKHAYWDNPKFEEGQMTELIMFLYTVTPKDYIPLLMETINDSTSYERMQVISSKFENMPDNYYKSFIRTMVFERMRSKISSESRTIKETSEYIRLLYSIAQGDSPVPQNAFFACWSDAVTDYIILDAIDSVKVEAERMLAICRQQNLPYGIVIAYSTLGDCFEHLNDYEGASYNYEKAIDAYNEYSTERFGANWKKKLEEKADISVWDQMIADNACCYLESGDTSWLRRNISDLEAIYARYVANNEKGSIMRNLLYVLSIYHDKWGDSKKYQYYVSENRKFYESTNTGDLEEYEETKKRYLTILLRHNLRNHQPEKALENINAMPQYFRDSTMSYYPDALLQLHRYQEAAERYKLTIDYYYHQLNGHNRSILKTMSSGLGESDHQMQMMQAQLKNQQTRLLYNSLLIFVLAIMIGGLGYFLYRQHRLNKDLARAMNAAERASHVKDIFLKNMTHEFHTPLNALYGFSQILADPNMPLDEESTREMASDMVKSSEHITRLLDNIVDVTEKLSKLDHLEDVESIIKVQQTSSQESAGE